MRWTCFEKRNFMGIELDVLVGHPEHDLLFVAAQVAKAAGITDPKYAIRDYLHRVAMVRNKPGMQIKELLVGNVGNSPTITEDEARAVIHYPRWRDAWVLNESSVYEMLTRGHAPQSEPFRKWVFEEVLPTIRKTGQYNAAESSDPIAVGIMDELKLLRGEFSRVTGELVELKGLIRHERISLP